MSETVKNELGDSFENLPNTSTVSLVSKQEKNGLFPESESSVPPRRGGVFEKGISGSTLLISLRYCSGQDVRKSGQSFDHNVYMWGKKYYAKWNRFGAIGRHR